MSKARMEAFSDGVIAIIITIMVLELRVPDGNDIRVLLPVAPVFFSYVLSFVFLGIYWNNHHHLLQAAKHVDGKVLWANLHLLFWLTLIPFVTAFMGHNHGGALASALYGCVMFFAATAYFVLTRTLIAANGRDSILAIVIGNDLKGKISLALYGSAIVLAFALPWASIIIYVLVAIMWLVPDRRIEMKLNH